MTDTPQGAIDLGSAYGRIELDASGVMTALAEAGAALRDGLTAMHAEAVQVGGQLQTLAAHVTADAARLAQTWENVAPALQQLHTWTVKDGGPPIIGFWDDLRGTVNATVSDTLSGVAAMVAAMERVPSAPAPRTAPTAAAPSSSAQYHINVTANSRDEGAAAGRGLYDELVRRGML